MMPGRCGSFAALGLTSTLLCVAQAAHAQEKYEIEVYSAQTVMPKSLMLELHSNFTFEGQPLGIQGVAPTNHALHETIEGTFGVTPWSELAVYLFTAKQNEVGTDIVGSHVRSKIRVPESWGWPVDLALSTEVGYVKPAYSRDTWTIEVRPIIDRYQGRWYFSFNPAFEKARGGLGVGDPIEFTPSAKISYDVTQVLTAGVEYYGAADEVILSSVEPGPVFPPGGGSGTGFDRLAASVGRATIAKSATSDADAKSVAAHQHQFFAAFDLHLSPLWEVNFGVGVGATPSTDHIIAKVILGRLFTWGRPDF